MDSVFLKDLLEALAPLTDADKPVAVWAIGDTRCIPILRRGIEPMGAPVFAEIARGAMVLSRVFKEAGT